MGIHGETIQIGGAVQEIKFRAWDKKTAEMYDVIEAGWRNVFGLRIGYLQYPSWGSRSRTPDEVVLMQFTGLTDKNGKKAFENDKVIAEAIDAKGDCHEVQGWIEWDSEEVGYVVMASGNWPVIRFPYIAQFKVVGNIYENPELKEDLNHEEKS